MCNLVRINLYENYAFKKEIAFNICFRNILRFLLGRTHGANHLNRSLNDFNKVLNKYFVVLFIGCYAYSNFYLSVLPHFPTFRHFNAAILLNTPKNEIQVV